MAVKKAVITAAGLGTRLLPMTKEVPKEMLPLFSASNGSIGLKPVIHMVFESLINVDISEFCFVVGRGKRVLEDYFTPDSNFAQLLESRGLIYRAKELLKFYSIINSVKVFFINQPKPKGFGDAVLRTESFVGDEPFLLHAGDDVILSSNGDHLRRLMEVFTKHDADGVILVEEVEDPRPYGVIIGKAVNSYGNVLRVLDIIEKPREPPTNIAAIAIYIFKPKIFSYIKEVKPDERGEIQLTAAIKAMVDDGCDVYAIKLKPSEKRLDVGTPQSYWKALFESYQRALKRLLEHGKR